jgi:hypothetical protein
MIAEKRHEPGSSMILNENRFSEGIMLQHNNAQWLTIIL